MRKKFWNFKAKPRTNINLSTTLPSIYMNTCWHHGVLKDVIEDFLGDGGGSVREGDLVGWGGGEQGPLLISPPLGLHITYHGIVGTGLY